MYIKNHLYTKKEYNNAILRSPFNNIPKSSDIPKIEFNIIYHYHNYRIFTMYSDILKDYYNSINDWSDVEIPRNVDNVLTSTGPSRDYEPDEFKAHIEDLINEYEMSKENEQRELRDSIKSYLNSKQEVNGVISKFYTNGK